MNTMAALGDVYPGALRAARKSLGLKQKDLGDMLHVQPSTVSAWECGRCTPSREYWDDIERILGVETSMFEKYDPEPIAEMLRATREALGLSKHRLGRMAGIDYCTVLRAEKLGRCQAPVFAKMVSAMVRFAEARGIEDAIPGELVEVACKRLKNWSQSPKPYRAMRRAACREVAR